MRKIVCILPTVISVIFGIVGWFVLPDMVAVQVRLDGQLSNRIPKIAAILVPVAISVFGTVYSLKKEEQSKNKGVILLIVGPVIMILTLIINL